MLVDIGIDDYYRDFTKDPHPFISKSFIQLNRDKVDRLIALTDSTGKPELGLICGIRDKVVISPFSAPFGGFHFKNEKIYIDRIDSFLDQLKDFVVSTGLDSIKISLPPDIYHMTINAKFCNSFLRKGYVLEISEITNWIDLNNFNNRYDQKNSREYYRQALRCNLVFSDTKLESDIKEIYNLIKNNRSKYGRPIYMSLDDIKNMEGLVPVDYFKVLSQNGEIVASAIFYRIYNNIAYAVFWGDNDSGRPLRAMDFLIFNLLTYFKELGFRFIDLGRSTEDGLPNIGLLRFKETHQAVSSIRYRFCWYK